MSHCTPRPAGLAGMIFGARSNAGFFGVRWVVARISPDCAVPTHALNARDSFRSSKFWFIDGSSCDLRTISANTRGRHSSRNDSIIVAGSSKYFSSIASGNFVATDGNRFDGHEYRSTRRMGGAKRYPCNVNHRNEGYRYAPAILRSPPAFTYSQRIAISLVGPHPRLS